MKHLGDITLIHGDEVPSVDCIIGGSPCQDLSVAGKRAGIQHNELGNEETTRSGLFMEQIRIIKEMRGVKNDKETSENFKPCRWAIWENVPGALSSPGGNKKGQDFRCVLEEFARVAEPSYSVPMPTDGKWESAGCIIGQKFSIAWRTTDAQYFGVPQRRRRICLVADFEGHTAPAIVFEPVERGGNSFNYKGESSFRNPRTKASGKVQPIKKGLFGNFNESKSEGEKYSRPTEECTGADDSQELTAYTLQVRCGKEGGGKGALVQEDRSATLSTCNIQTLFQPVGIDGYNADITYDKAATLGVNCGMSTGRNGIITEDKLYSVDMGGGKSSCSIHSEVSPTLTCTHQGEPVIAYNDSLSFEPGIAGREGGHIYNDVSGTLRSNPGDNQMSVVYNTVALEGNGSRPSHRGDGYIESDKSYTLNTTEVHGVAYNDEIITVSHGGFMTNPQSNLAHTLEASDYKDAQVCAYSICSYNSNSMKSDNPDSGIYKADTSRTLDLNGGNPACNQGGLIIINKEEETPSEESVIIKCDGAYGGDTSFAIVGDHDNRPTDMTNLVVQTYRKQSHPRTCDEGQGWEETDKSDTLNVFDNAEVRTPNLIVSMDRASYNQGKNALYDMQFDENGKAYTETSRGPGAVCYNFKNKPNYVVRRLTPCECEALQGFPNNWTNIGDWVDTKGKLHSGSSDAPRYKALGNSISIPNWTEILTRLHNVMGRDGTMASLFDGIGGFPLIWEGLNGKGTAKWASEIEEFPIAVTKYHFPETE